MPPFQIVADDVDVERLLGDEDLGRAACDAGLGRDPPGMSAHHLAHDDAIVRLGRGVQPVDGVGRDLHGGVETECHLCCRQVVVDRLRNTDDADGLGTQPVRDAEGVLTADGDERVDPVRPQRGQRLLDAALDLVRVRARRAEDRPALGEQATAPLDVERHRRPLDDTAPAVVEPHELVLVVALALAHDGADHRVEPRAVATPGE